MNVVNLNKSIILDIFEIREKYEEYQIKSLIVTSKKIYI